MKPLSDKRAAIDRRMKITYREIETERSPYCEETGSPDFDHSHNYPRSLCTWLIANPDNITLLSRDAHMDFQNNELWKLPNNGPRIMRQMMAFILSEEDPDRRKLMRSHYVGKLYAMKEQAENQEVVLPGWCLKLLEEIGI